MEPQTINHYQVNGKYRVYIERAASTKGVLGYKVEANGDDILGVIRDIKELKQQVETMTPMPVIPV